MTKPEEKPTLQLLTAQDVAKILQVKVQYLSWLRRRHGLPYIRVGSEVRFREQDINTWVQKRAAAGST